MNAVGRTAEGGEPVTEFGKLDSRDAEAGITKPGELTELKA
ncbi:hypothetical protein predicted by Glimmer/Critica [Sorangium cellulosum So ce56]|uniref:Uncharacterized protein n=1 Tax=Sorangium cellulosum (strain So ce56) TaxID=448385 RepID=A9FY42_SORC5|nr:hypothetical protein predicted by Glimmer/Critica [Sorangium cellulosum So ce56]